MRVSVKKYKNQKGHKNYWVLMKSIISLRLNQLNG